MTSYLMSRAFHGVESLPNDGVKLNAGPVGVSRGQEDPPQAAAGAGHSPVADGPCVI